MIITTGRETHPLFPLLTAEQESAFGPDRVNEYYEIRKQSMLTVAADQFHYGYEPKIWTTSDAAIADLRKRFPTGVITELDLGGNRAAKTERRAKRLVQNMVNNPGWKAWALQSTEESSRQNQQNYIYKYLPSEWKPNTGKLRSGVTTKIVYSQAGGFTENTLVCPNGSQLWFKFYSMNVGSLEGAELNEVWGDELITLDWIEAVTYRLVTRNGILYITFTPVDGYTQTVKHYVSEATLIEEQEAELLPLRDKDQNVIGYEKMPRLRLNLSKRAVIVNFWTEDNPFGNYESMKETLAGKTTEKIKERAYGEATKSVSSQFPLFADSVHVISWERFLEVVAGGGVRYHLVDPCSGRNWFMQWHFIDPLGRDFIYREWPSYGHPEAYIPGIGELGPWAEPGKPADGLKGPAQIELGWGLRQYAEEMARLEGSTFSENADGEWVISGGEEIWERWMDARYGNARTVGAEESTTLIEELEKRGLLFLASKSEKQILGDSSSGSIRLINDALYYNKAKPIGPLNQPKLYVVDRCPNTIYALKEWTGADGQKGACKDPVDIVRMKYLSDLDYIDGQMLCVRTMSRR